jgi:hypothetical protein
LQDCVAALDANPDVDWVHGGGQILEHSTGKVLTDNVFYVDGKPRPFLQLRARESGALRIIEDQGAAIACQIRHGLYCGLQKSVLRRSVFQKLRFESSCRNEAEDQLFVIRALAAGHRLGYLDNIHLLYYVHDENSSGSSKGLDLDKRLRLIQLMIQGYEDLPGQVPLTPAQRWALRHRLSHEHFWTLGYSLLWNNGRKRDALRRFRRGLWLWPFELRYWKTYLLAVARTLVSTSGISCT